MLPPSPLPVANSTTSFWRRYPHPLDNYRSTPDVPSQVDIAVVGAGYAGVSTVHHVLDICKRRGTAPPDMVILDARQACSGATGRNGGHLKPDPLNRPASLAITHGIEVAAECATFEARNLSAVKKTIEDEDIDCDFVLTRAVDVSMADSVCDKMKSGFDMLRKHAFPGMQDVHFAKGADAKRVASRIIFSSLSGVKGAKGCLSYSAGHLFPYKLILHLLSSAVDAGVNLQTHTPVTEATKLPDAEGYFTLTTPRGSIRAKEIVYATNGYTSSLLPEFADTIIPARGICSHIKPAKNPAPFLPNSYMIRWSETEYEYLIPRPDGSIVVGGARSKFYHELDSWYNNVNDDMLIDSATTYFNGYMQRVFQGWEDSGAYTSKLWTGSKFPSVIHSAGQVITNKTR
ncbi:hypothetical protein QQZ08_004653 [Neonectria magnoliae]|uniref:FAD dependent oxidoreductase domain-containing protein n=1 Tax=Neonectria magnoliae TaxID=2732573 RepID=A0ABR1I7P8_9HYPO